MTAAKHGARVLIMDFMGCFFGFLDRNSPFRTRGILKSRPNSGEGMAARILENQGFRRIPKSPSKLSSRENPSRNFMQLTENPPLAEAN